MAPNPPVILYTIGICEYMCRSTLDITGFTDNSLRKHTLFTVDPAGMAHKTHNRQHTCRSSTVSRRDITT